MTKTTQDALAAISGTCDGARDHDGVGFSGVDAEFGKDLAHKGLTEGWTEKQHGAAKRLCHKYRKQLAGFGFDAAALAGEDFATAEGLNRRVVKAPAAAPGYVKPTNPIDGFPNRFPGKCGCGARVDVGHGRCTKRDGRWVTYCAECAEPTREADRAEAVAEAAAVRAMVLGEPMVAIRPVGPHGEALDSTAATLTRMTRGRRMGR